MGKDYEKWKAGEKVWKAPWVIEYYQSVTDENQYRLGSKVRHRLVLIISGLMGIYGFLLGYWIGGL